MDMAVARPTTERRGRKLLYLKYGLEKEEYSSLAIRI
jgi:hypothetical protein